VTRSEETQAEHDQGIRCSHYFLFGRDLPKLLADGGFKHGGHIAFARKNNKLMSNLFVRMLQQMDIEMDRFGSAPARSTKCSEQRKCNVMQAA